MSPVNVSGKGTGQAGGRTWASRLAFSHSSRRTWFMRSLFCLLEAWFWVRRSCIMTASASTAAGRSPCSPPGSVPAAASTEVRVGGGPRRRQTPSAARSSSSRTDRAQVPVPAERVVGLLAGEAADSTFEKAGGRGRI